jgi:hypothetical protein
MASTGPKSKDRSLQLFLYCPMLFVAIGMDVSTKQEHCKALFQTFKNIEKLFCLNVVGCSKQDIMAKTNHTNGFLYIFT